MEAEANSPIQSENRHRRRKKSRRHESVDNKSARSLHVPLELNPENDKRNKHKDKSHNQHEHQPKAEAPEHVLNINHGELEIESEPEPKPEQKSQAFESQLFQLRDTEPEPTQTYEPPKVQETKPPEPQTSEPYSLDQARQQVDQQILEDARTIPEPQTREVPYETYNPYPYSRPIEQPRTEAYGPAPPLPEPEEEPPLPTDHHLEHSVWHSIEVDNKTGQAVENPMAEYGQAYQAEHRPETHINNPDPDEPPEAAIASGQLAVDHSASDNSPNQSSRPAIANTLRANSSRLTSRYQSALSNIGPLIDSDMGDFILWVILIIIIIAIIIVLVA